MVLGRICRIEGVPLLIDLAEHATLEGLGVEHVGVQKDNKAQILTDAHFATNVASIYAIGDVIAGPMLAHKAEDEDVAVAEMPPAARVTRVPNVVYTFPFPAVASVSKFPFTANAAPRSTAPLTAS
ncbi:MAG: Dihydrolipoyl dehydrogenase [Nitrobacter vulgaris]|nr:Dihydrolipoyl dehydrogenase [Nitrobacter vulgaris]